MAQHASRSTTNTIVTAVDALSRAQKHVSQIVAEALSESGYREIQWRTLRVLADHGAMTMSELASVLVLPPATMTRTVDELSSRSLCYRRPSDRDARSVTVHISRSGRDQLHILDGLVESRSAHIRAVLNEHSAALHPIAAHGFPPPPDSA